jgi:branched-chain amino acid transport system ATP-binding protein
MGMILEIDHITKRFGGLVAVDNVSLSISEGQIFGLIGPNGAGKTTLLNVIAGVHKPESGRILYQGKSIHGQTPDSLCRKGISRTFQICQPFPKLTALENVMVAAVFGNRKPATDSKQLATEMLNLVSFSMPHNTLAQNLNTVQLKQVDLARALASSPNLLLLDEIGAGLTPLELEDLMQLICRIQQERGITIILVEHVMHLVMGICHRLAVLQFGQLISQGTCDEIAHDQRVVEAYLG